jgi:hypothetical protein
VSSGSEAAIDVGREFGILADDPLLVQETNNTVVWLKPHQVIAKVGSRVDSADALIREFEVASQLVPLRARVAAPLEGSAPVRHEATGLVVTLWNRVDHDGSRSVPNRALARSLGEIHAALRQVTIPLPSFRVGMTRARELLSDDERMAALAQRDRSYLRNCFDDLSRRLDASRFAEQPPHGEPHSGNCLLGVAGPCWIDFENVCRGPREWDLAFLPEGARRLFRDVDHDLLGLLSTLNSVMVATWCWAQARFPEMRRHGEHHLGVVRASWRGPT